MPDFRMKRVSSLLRDEISSMIMNGTVKDPRIGTFISVTEVKVSKDTVYAKVYISTFQTRQKLDGAVSALNNAAGFIQHKLGKKLKMRNTPKLTFVADTSIEDGMRMAKKLEELNSE